MKGSWGQGGGQVGLHCYSVDEAPLGHGAGGSGGKGGRRARGGKKERGRAFVKVTFRKIHVAGALAA